MNTKTSTKTILPALLLGLMAWSGAASAGGALGNCYAPLQRYLQGVALPAPTRELFVVIDQTLVPDDALRRELLKRALETLRRGDRITVATFSAYASGHYTELAFTGSLDIPLPQDALREVPIKSARAYNRCLQGQWERGRALILKQISEAVTTTDDDYDFRHTELIGALHTLAADLIQKSPAPERTVLLFTDGLENSRTMTMFKQGALRLIGPETELAKVRKAGMIADLDGVKVYLIGGGWLADGNLYRDSQKLQRIRGFWTRYFKAAGAALEGYGEPLLLTAIQ